MFEVQTEAQRELKNFFSGKEPQPLRVFLKEKTCGGPRLVIGLDERCDDDTVFEIDGLTFVIETAFFEKIKPVRIDFTDGAFTVTAAVSFGGGCAGCGCTGTCG